jgi:glyoxylase-like metal-dependent hydrolase (beta-lactamase superfamily II)
MRTLRIRLTLLAGVLLCSVAAYTQNQAPVTPSKLNKISDDLYELQTADQGTSNGGNVAIYITPEGVILVDDKFALNFDDIIASVKSVTDKPVKYVISTHHHGDHTGSSAKMIAGGALVVAHRNNRLNMERGKMPGLPQITFADEAEVFLGGKQIRTYHPGNGHTNGDAVVLFPAQRTIHTGDLFVSSAPLIDYTNGGNLTEWPATLDNILKLDFDTVIPGHGPIMKKADILAFRTKLQNMRGVVTTMLREKKTKDEITQTLIRDFGFQLNTPQIGRVDGILAEFQGK